MNAGRQPLKEFYDSVGDHYDEEEAVYKTLRGRLRRQFVIDWLMKQRGSLLEIGANRGMYVSAYEGGKRVGVDLSLSVLKHARHSKPVHYAVADAERLHCFKPASFDRVLCSEVIEHCFSPQAVFDSIRHVLKINGQALITTPNYRGNRPTWIELGSMKELGIQGDWGDRYFHTAFRPEELADMAQQSGLIVLEAGTLEKQVKYAAKLPALVLLAGRKINRLIRSSQFGQWNEDFFQQFSLFIDAIIRFLGLETLFLRFVKEGVRSYIIVLKNSSCASQSGN
jgi:2-polyprenyl-3-methyl-5-hydroxy-6-metoxy-1,4-benzoquinol methylase